MLHFRSYREYLNHWVFKVIRAVAMGKTAGKCSHCGALATEVHHLTYPKPWGAFDVPANLQPLCHACHCLTHGKDS